MAPFLHALSPRTFREQTVQDHQGSFQDRLEYDNGTYVAFAWALSDKKTVDRFWSYVRRTDTDDCWLWTSNCVGRGNKTSPHNSKHGQFAYTFRKHQYHVPAHRFAYGLVHGPILPSVWILHRCDVPPCCNVRHLFPGDHLMNMQDAALKNRFSVPRERGLSLFDRLTIYHTGAYRGVCVDLARRYNVTKACISLIRAGRFIGSGVWHGTKVSMLEHGDAEVETTIRIKETG